MKKKVREDHLHTKKKVKKPTATKEAKDLSNPMVEGITIKPCATH